MSETTITLADYRNRETFGETGGQEQECPVCHKVRPDVGQRHEYTSCYECWQEYARDLMEMYR